MHYGNTAPRIADPLGQLNEAISDVRRKLDDVNSRDQEARRTHMYDSFALAKARVALAHERAGLENRLAKLQQSYRNNGGGSINEWRPAPSTFFHGSES